MIVRREDESEQIAPEGQFSFSRVGTLPGVEDWTGLLISPEYSSNRTNGFFELKTQ